MIPIVVGALGTVSKGLLKTPKKAGTTISVELLQKTAHTQKGARVQLR